MANNKFQFKGFISEPTRALLTTTRTPYIKWDDPNSATIFIEPSIMKISILSNSFKQAKLTGSNTQKIFAIAKIESQSKWERGYFIKGVL